MVKEIRKRILAMLVTLALVISLMPALTLPARAGVLGSYVTFSSTAVSAGPYQVVNEPDAGMEFDNLIDVDEGTIKLYFNNETGSDAFDLTFSGGSLDSISTVSGPTWTNTGSWDDFMVGGAATIDPSNPKILHFEQIDPDPDSINQVFTGYATWTFTTDSSNVAPTVTSVSVPSNGTYKIGDALNFTVSFDSVVVVTGTPRIPVTLNTGGTVYASYVSGSDSRDLVFRYTVSSGQLDADGILLGSAINLNSGTIKTSGEVNAELDLHSVAATTGVLVDGVAPTITSVSPPSNATYIAGQNLDYTVNFSEAVNVVTTGGTPYLTLTVGSSTVQAAYQSGTGGSALTFRYTVAAGNADADGVALSSNITPNGGTIKDAAGNDATLTFSGGTAADVKVSTVPTVTTTSVTTFTSTTATLGGNVTADGGETVTDRGVVYSSTDATPTIGEPGVTQDANGTGTGSFSESVTGLSPGTTYYVRAYATNSLGTVHGPVVSFTTSPAAPTATTGAASSITSTAATLSGTVNANGASSTVTFEYGTTTGYGSSVTASQSPVTGTNSTSVSGSITGLVPNSTYHFRVKAVNSVGTTNGSDQTFTTSAIAPTATTNSATDIVTDAATLNGTVNANNAETTVTFEYGTTTGYGSTATASQSPVTGTSSTSVSCNITDLTPNTTYYYRVVAVNDGGTTYGAQKTFSTDVTAPTILSASRTDDTHITVTLSEACQNLTKANDGGFTVTKNGTATTFAVSATAQGADSSHVVLTVADMGAAGSAGVTVTYTAGGNGTIADIEGNEMETNTTGAVIAAWDTAAPTVSSINRNSPLTASTNLTSVTYRVTFSEAVTGVDTSDFSLTTTKTISGTIASVSAAGGTTYDVTVSLISGAGTLRLDLNDSGTDITDSATNAISGGFNTGEIYSIDVIAPTILSASRTDDTHITVTLSKDCVQITKANNGGFTVTETGTPASQYSVSAIAQGSDASHVVLTVANLGVSAKEGLNVKYTAGGNGTVEDTFGNAMETDGAGVSIASWDTAAPTIQSGTLSADNTYVDITFSEGVYGADGGTTALTAPKFLLTFTQNSGTATNASIHSVKTNTGADLAGGETTVRVFLIITGTPNGLETIEINPATGTSIYDKGGNAMLSSQTSGVKQLNDTAPPRFHR
ncbi:hypothetical protein SDC9_53364 [bioreactor metagenome]|uniref:Fibronectin type-III domain-containing protein n=1 Tax=bioreactor metagenome TaxID=1076179 RepID=A0A644WT69_9ZZZZ